MNCGSDDATTRATAHSSRAVSAMVSASPPLLSVMASCMVVIRAHAISAVSSFSPSYLAALCLESYPPRQEASWELQAPAGQLSDIALPESPSCPAMPESPRETPMLPLASREAPQSPFLNSKPGCRVQQTSQPDSDLMRTGKEYFQSAWRLSRPQVLFLNYPYSKSISMSPNHLWWDNSNSIEPGGGCMCIFSIEDNECNNSIRQHSKSISSGSLVQSHFKI